MPDGTISSTSTMHILPAVATSGLKFLADFLNTTIPFSSALHAFINEKSPLIDFSRI